MRKYSLELAQDSCVYPCHLCIVPSSCELCEVDPGSEGLQHLETADQNSGAAGNITNINIRTLLIYKTVNGLRIINKCRASSNKNNQKASQFTGLVIQEMIQLLLNVRQCYSVCQYQGCHQAMTKSAELYLLPKFLLLKKKKNFFLKSAEFPQKSDSPE